jgi:hypothetical protein
MSTPAIVKLKKAPARRASAERITITEGDTTLVGSEQNRFIR